jgi:hypothetical protein
VPSPSARRSVCSSVRPSVLVYPERSARTATRGIVLALLTLALVACSGCGGGSSAAQELANPSVSPDFAIVVSAASLTVSQGSTSPSLTISVSGQGGFNDPVAVTMTGLPSGVVSNPASPIAIAPGSSVAILFAAGPYAAAGAFAITANGVSGSLAHSATFSLSVQSTVGYSAQVYANSAFSGQSSPYKFLLYDKMRQLLYFSAPGSIDVFDLQAGAFKPNGLALDCPNLKSPGACPNDDIRGLALAPDASQLFAADFGSQNIYLLDPDTPATPATAVPVVSTGDNPTHVAATNSRTLFVALSAQATPSGICTACLSQLDLTATPLAIESSPEPVVSNLVGSPLLQADAAGDRVFFAYATPSAGGPLGLWASPGTFTISTTTETPTDLAVAPDGTLFATAVGGSIEVHGVDSSLSLIGTFAVPAQSLAARVPVPGIAMHPSGALVYQPFLSGAPPAPPQPGVPPAAGPQSGVDILDSHTGQLRLRVLLPEPLSATSADTNGLQAQFIVVDETGQRIFALTVSGLTIVQLVNVPLGIGTLFPAAGSAAGGTVVTVRGSGFQPATTVTLGGKSVTTTFKDANTLLLTAPPLPPGLQPLVLSNPDGETVSLAAAFVAN